MTLRLTYNTAYLARGGTTHGPLYRAAPFQDDWTDGQHTWTDAGKFVFAAGDHPLDLIAVAPTPPAFATSA